MPKRQLKLNLVMIWLNSMKKPVYDNEYFKEHLTSEQYHVLREGGTEKPFTGEYVDKEDDGRYSCAACHQHLFESSAQFHSGSGWPRFSDVFAQGNIELKEDDALGMKRTEVTCAHCGSHLGHVFDDGQTETGKRYCVNSLALDFEKKDK